MWGEGRNKKCVSRAEKGNGERASSSAEGLLEVAAHNGHKLGLLRQLLGEGQVADVEIQQPSLEDLYCYYMQRAESTAPAGES